MKNKKVSRNVWLLGLVSFLNDLSSEMIMPILPMFLSSVGATEAAIGLVGGVRDSLSSILKIFFGWFSDRYGKRKLFVFSGYGVSALFKFLLALSAKWQQAFAAAGLERVGKGMRTAPRDAIISASTRESRGRSFGVHRAMDTSGAILGSLAVFVLFWFLNLDFKTIILVAAGASFLSLIPIGSVREKKHAGTERRKYSLRISLKGIPRDLRKFILVASVFSLSRFSYMFFVLRARGVFEGRLSVGIPILLYVLYNIFYAAFSIPAGVLSDRTGRKKVLAGGYLLFCIVCAGFALFDSLVPYIVLFGLYGIVYAVIDGNQRAFVSDMSGAELRGTSLGTFHTITGLAALPASIIAGMLFQIDPVYAFAYGGIMSLISVILMIRLVQK